MFLLRFFRKIIIRLDEEDNFFCCKKSVFGTMKLDGSRKGVYAMIDEKQTMSCDQPQRATINISGKPEDDDDELLAMLYYMIKEEREKGLRMQKGNITDSDSNSSY